MLVTEGEGDDVHHHNFEQYDRVVGTFYKLWDLDEESDRAHFDYASPLG